MTRTRSDIGPVPSGTASDLVGSASRRVPDADPEQQARHLLATTGQEPVCPWSAFEKRREV
ncbi:hypothetical protein ACFWCF_16560 [Rhodococcus sp. NPDC060090]|uniref:hypothetical protein n=1 Tax=Rhodococcus sp. NPDC060090 TaxID=3347056 RepID=UPI00364E8C20